MTMADLTRISAAMKTKDDAFFKRLGARIAQARKQMDMTQVQLAERLGVAQQTLAHYEVGRARIAADLLPVLAEALELSLDEMLIGESATRPAGKRGPASRLQQQIDAIGQLPKAKQRFVVEMIDTVLAQNVV
jgi:transcriptional regulator with XRE-family HTH domain